MCYGAETEVAESSDSDVQAAAEGVKLAVFDDLLYVQVDGGPVRAIFIKGEIAKNDTLTEVFAFPSNEDVVMYEPRQQDQDADGEFEQTSSDPDSEDSRLDRLAAAQEDTGVSLHEQVDLIEKIGEGEVIGFARIDNPATGIEGDRMVVVNVADIGIRVVHPDRLLPSVN